MKTKKHTHIGKLLLALICISLFIAPVCNAGVQVPYIQNHVSNTDFQPTKATEYWALIFAVGEYLNHPDENRPSMLAAADDLYQTLLDSPQWTADHIHIVKGSQATGKRLIQELIWLIQNDKSEDMVLVYITTHGSPLRNGNGYPVDLPPKDEADGADEILVMYEGFDKWYAFIWDDLLNFFLNRLQASGVCLIVDSCFSGGFNDLPAMGMTSIQNYNAASFASGLAEELAAQNRVVLMSCRENEVSYGSDFSNLLILGFEGWADLTGNGDGINSAEESFTWAEFWLNLYGQQHPTILDYYPGEFTVTYT